MQTTKIENKKVLLRVRKESSCKLTGDLYLLPFCRPMV